MSISGQDVMLLLLVTIKQYLNFLLFFSLEGGSRSPSSTSSEETRSNRLSGDMEKYFTKVDEN